MCGVTKAEQSRKGVTLEERIVNSNTITPLLTCVIVSVIFAVLLRPTSDGGGRDGYDNSGMLMKKLTKV